MIVVFVHERTLHLRTVSDWQPAAVISQLAKFGKVIDYVPHDGSSLYESIARQIRCDQIELWNIVRNEAENNLQEYETHPVLKEENTTYFMVLPELCNGPGICSHAASQLALHIIQNVLKVNIIVFTNDDSPQLFLGNIDLHGNNTVVIVQQSDQLHYDSTKYLAVDSELPPLCLQFMYSPSVAKVPFRVYKNTKITFTITNALAVCC